MKSILAFLLRRATDRYRRRVKCLTPGGHPALHMAFASDMEFASDFEREDDQHERRTKRLRALESWLQKLSV